MWCDDHTIEKDLNNDQQVLMREEHKVLQAGVDAGLSRSINLLGGMCEQVEKLDQTANSQGLKFLCFEEGLP